MINNGHWQDEPVTFDQRKYLLTTAISYLDGKTSQLRRQNPFFEHYEFYDNRMEAMFLTEIKK